MNSASTSQQVDTVLKTYQGFAFPAAGSNPANACRPNVDWQPNLNVSRAHVRTAFQKLEFYGIAKTFPQSGTVVAQEKMQVLNSMIIDRSKSTVTISARWSTCASCSKSRP